MDKAFSVVPAWHLVWRGGWHGIRRAALFLVFPVLLIACTSEESLAVLVTPSGLLVSEQRDRSDATELAGYVANGGVYIFTAREQGVRQVRFYLDDPARSDAPLQAESNVPFDFAGGSVALAETFDTTEVPDGEHTITAVLTLDDDATQVAEASFQVQNRRSEPAPTPTPEPAPPRPVFGLARLVESYHVIKEYSRHEEPSYAGVVYRPGQGEGGRDLLSLPGGTYRTYTRPDWLHLTLRRNAKLTVVWNGSNPASWLSSWQRSGNEYTKAFKAGDVVLGSIGGTVNNAYTVLFAEADGRPTAAPEVPAGLTTPRANAPCPGWVHDQHVARGPDGQMYRTWHPQIDPVYWCYFGHDHGSDPSLVGDYQPVFEYVAAHVPQNETPHEGFKGYSILDGAINWYIGVHGGTADHRRICAPLHTVVVVAFNASSREKLAELSYKGDFGPTKTNSEDNPVVRPPQCDDQRELDAGTNNEKKVRIANHSRYRNTGYETWRGGDNPTLGFDAKGAMIFDFLNPMTSCDTLSCADVVATGEAGEKRDILFAEDSRLRYLAELDPNRDGVFYTDVYGERLLPASSPNAVRQFVKPGLNVVGPRQLYYTEDAWRMAYHEGRVNTPGMNLEGGLGRVN